MKNYLFSNIDREQLHEDILKKRNCNFVVLYHDKCMDGAVSAALVVRYMQDTYGKFVTLYPVQYGCDIVICKPEDYVIIVDFSFEPERLQELATLVSGLLIVDHHYTATSTIEQYVKTTMPEFNYFLDVDPAGKNACGASLTHKLFGSGHSSLVELTTTHDLWKHNGDLNHDALKLNYSFSDKCRCLDASNPVVKLFTNLIDNDSEVNEWIENGQKIVEASVAVMQKTIDDTGVFYKVGFDFGTGVQVMTVPIVNSAKSGTSVLGGELARHYGVGVTYFYDAVGGKYVYSLRSHSQDYDVSHYAKSMGGGGHRNAAGFTSRSAPEQLYAVCEEQPQIKFDPYRKEV